MNIRALAASLSVVGLMLAAVGCSVDSREPPATEESSVESTTQALANNGGGPGYSCTPAGFCQCQGFDDCLNMAYICKRFWYCNDDAQGHRCGCWNFVTRPQPIAPPIGKIGPTLP